MAVRNFFIEADVDGRKTDVATGPRSKDGGMGVRIYQRAKGGITTALRIVSRPNLADPNTLETLVYNGKGELVHYLQTER